MRSAWILLAATVVSAASAAPAAAGPLTDALAKHDDAAIASLRAQLAAAPASADLRCTLGAAYARHGDLPRADLYLAGCGDAVLDAEVAGAVARAIHDLKPALRDSQLASIDIDIQPEGLAGLEGEVDALPGERFAVPRTIYVPAGHRVVRVLRDGKAFEVAVETQPHAGGPLIVRVDTPAAPPPHEQHADFRDSPTDAPEIGSPPDVKHPPLKIAVVDAHTVAEPAGDQIADPLETHATRSALRFGARIGGGVFGETGGDARVGPSLAALAAIELAPRVSLQLRGDWTRRGSDGTDAIGATLGPAITALRVPALELRAGAGVRADLRLESSTVFRPPHGAENPQLAAVANDANVSWAAWLDVPLRHVPVVIGARYERSLTSLGFGVHDSAAIVELGWELR